MILKKTMFTEEYPDGTIVHGIALIAGFDTLSFFEGKVEITIARYCFVAVDQHDPLAQIPDGQHVKGEIVLMRERSNFEFNEDQEPVKLYSTYGYRENPNEPLKYRTSMQQVVGEI